MVLYSIYLKSANLRVYGAVWVEESNPESGVKESRALSLGYECTLVNLYIPWNDSNKNFAHREYL